ncbi:tetratricopeptide (TPR) repeat protein [Xanthomonas campestris]|uniref:AAA-like domain-containing protein n=1 Tax=Xanthomonas euroxanthea TaxID=2259622 RepID=UPI0016167C7E|nr:AAA-like domain-containing protein [Xanthomonas euroxanthea]MBB3777976.1 tetratricopeptide (TPR) repeat protein [Xanthomonas euroxanthea]
MKKVLKPCTIIPDELYVERSADRQLSRIVSEMGRPGYVLVARQMGKTNLLLNARRKSDKNSLFVYVDVSNSVPDLRSFFRGVVDTCLDCDSVIPETVKHEIRASRRDSMSLEHREHESELRKILAHIPGDLVFFLDEIDALTKVEYSDRVFAFIRSVYFSGRTNFREFYRMTYVLSGVAEPSEIIKDRSISPFNIGEKIYLEDFDFAEFVDFTKKAGFEWSNEVLEKVFEWSSGNPRISWDICSALEEIVGEISTKDVDAVLEKLYLRAFDLPPVDHIRTLVQSDKDIRSAVMSIHYGKSDSISEAVRARMYLAGIISSTSFVGEVRIKNKVTEFALSERWLNEVEKEGISLEDHAESLFASGRYGDAYLTYLEMDTSGVVVDVEFHAYRKALCLYSIGQYKDSIQLLEASPYPRSRSRDFYIRTISLLGTMKLMLGEGESSISFLEKAILEYGDMGGDSPIDYLTCLANLSTAYISTGSDNVRSRELCDVVIARACARLDTSDQDSESLRALICSAYHNLYKVDLSSGNLASSESNLNRAIDYSGRSDKASLMLINSYTFKSDVSLELSLGACVDYCLQNSVPVKAMPIAERPLSFTISRAATLTYYVAARGQEAVKYLRDFLAYLCREDLGHEAGMAQVAHGASGIALKNGEPVASLILSEAVTIVSITSDELGRALVLNAAVLGSDEVLQSIRHKVLPVIKGERDSINAYVAHRLCKMHSKRGEFSAALEVIEAVDPGEDLCNIERLATVATRFIVVKRNGGQPQIAEVKATYDLIARMPIVSDSFYSRSSKSMLMAEILKEFPVISSIKSDVNFKYGRNDVIKVILSDGRAVVGKYKKFEDLLRRGQARVAD